MARLFGASGHTAEESTDGTRFVVYLDSFRATGRLHAASTLLHELTHVQRYRARGFHANRAASVLPKEDFVLLGLADEFAAYQAEANLVRRVLDSETKDQVRQAAREALRDPDLNWPIALTVLLGFEGPSEEGHRIKEARRQVLLDVEGTAGKYWESRHTASSDPLLRQKIEYWYKHSLERKTISAERPAWMDARDRLRRSKR
jgi:hypothetical protein